MKNLILMILLILMLVSCGGPTQEDEMEYIQQVSEPTYRGNVETTRISSYVNRIYDPDFGIVCYQTSNDIECFEVGG